MALDIAQLTHENGQAGVMAPTMRGWSGGGHTLGANIAYGARFRSSKRRAITAVKFVVSTFATADDAVDVAILDSSGARLVSSGATTGKLNTSNGVKSVALAYTIEPATTYIAVLSCGAVGGTAATLRGASFGSTDVVQVFGSGISVLEAWTKTASHPIPSSIASPSAASSVPVLWLVE